MVKATPTSESDSIDLQALDTRKYELFFQK